MFQPYETFEIALLFLFVAAFGVLIVAYALAEAFMKTVPRAWRSVKALSAPAVRLLPHRFRSQRRRVRWYQQHPDLQRWVLVFVIATFFGGPIISVLDDFRFQIPNTYPPLKGLLLLVTVGLALVMWVTALLVGISWAVGDWQATKRMTTTSHGLRKVKRRATAGG